MQAPRPSASARRAGARAARAARTSARTPPSPPAAVPGDGAGGAHRQRRSGAERLARAGATVALAVLLALAAPPARAWGPTGHRAIGLLAESYIAPRARAGLREILGSESLAEASTWPDFMRSSPDLFWRLRAGPWHYVTVPDGKTWEEVGPPPGGDAVTALRQFAATVRNPEAPLADRQLALRFIIHIVGDLSQPLHVGNGRDRGGNDVRVTFFGQRTNLHALWDAGIIDSQLLSHSEWAAWLDRRLTPEQLRAWSSPDPLQWVADSQAIRGRLYPRGSTDLGYAYVFEHLETLKEQLAKGGLRTAAYLNWLFDEEPPR